MLAIVLRLWGINFGLPYIYNIDEAENISELHTIFTAHDPNPGVFYYPSLFYYIQALAYPPYFLTAWLTGEVSQPGDIHGPVMVHTGVGKADRPMLFIMGRLISVVFGVGCVILAFHIAQQLAQDNTAGYLAAYLLAISPTLAENSHYLTPDIIVTFFVMLAAWGSFRVYRRGRTRDYVVAGIACGLAASAKYNGALIVVALAAAHFLRPRSNGVRDPRLYTCAILSIAAFFATSPYAILDYHAFIDGLNFNSTHYAGTHPGMEGNSIPFYTSYLFDFERLPAVLGVLAFVVGVAKRFRPMIVLASFPIIYFLFIGQFSVRNNRTLLPAIPFLLIAAAVLVAQIWRWASTHPQGRSTAARAALIGVTLIAVSLQLPRTLRMNQHLATYDVREKAMAWIDENLPITARIAIEPYVPYIDPTKFTGIVGIQTANKYAPGWFIEHAIDYLVMTNANYGPYFTSANDYPDRKAEYEALFDAFEWVTTIDNKGYEVQIYRVAPSG